MSFLNKLKAVLLFPLFVCLTSNLIAQQTPIPSNLEMIPDPLPIKKSASQKLDNGLQQVYQMETNSKSRTAARKKMAKDPLLMIKDDWISIELIAKQNTADLLGELTTFNFEQTAVFGKTISGKIHLDELKQLNTLKSLRYARPVYKPITRIGSVDSQGDTAMYADVARSNFSLDGAGLTIGALSDSYNTLSGEAAGIASGDLPGPGNPNGYTTPITVLAEYSSTGSDEARGMIELIHDVAPAAEIYARTAFEGEADFAQGILDLAAAGCDVIVDDVGYFAEPFFQDGLIAQAADSVSSNGVIYFSAAGNSGRKSYESSGFTASGSIIGGKPLHDFDTGSGVDYSQSITIPAGVTLSITLQWDDPFGSLPNSVDSADTDMDIYLINAGFTAYLARGNTGNIATGDPYEIISYTNSSSSDLSANIAIVHYDGPAPGFMKYVCWTNSVTINEYDTESSTIIGHPNSTAAIAVGAAAYYNTAAYGASPPAINSFSSAGGTPILFDKFGNPITTVYRQKPEIVGPDGSNTTFFGTDIANDSDSHPNFFGTSAAAPHAAAASLLLLELGATSRSDILDAFTNTTEDMDDPATSGNDSGFDYGTGFGMLRISSAITFLSSVLPVELTHFSATPLGTNGGHLSWSTAQELNNKSFILEHRDHYGAFAAIATIEGKGTSFETNHYSFDVYDLLPGDHYFRLWQSDWDGTMTDHGILSLTIQGKGHQVWSYRQDNRQQIAIQAEQHAELKVQVYNSSGLLVKTIYRQASQGERYTTEISAPDWPDGTYFYQVNILTKKRHDIQSGKFIL